MKELLKKEFTLTGAPITYVFLMFSLMVMIPGYPILVGGFFICLGIFYTFQFSREYNDVLYTALLPVNKRDVVKARYGFVVTIELIAVVITAGLTVLRMSLLADAPPYAENPMMNANLATLGYLFIVLALFNIVFIPGFYKTAYYFGKPFIIFGAVSFIFIGICETLHHLPGLEFLNTTGWDEIGIQCAILGGGILLFVIGTALSAKISAKRFEKIDL